MGIAACKSVKKEKAKLAEIAKAEFKVTGMFANVLEPKDTLAVTDFIAQKLDWTETGEQAIIQNVALYDLPAVSNAYNSKQNVPLWILSHRADSVFKALEEIEFDGLNPKDYGVAEILKLRETLLANPQKDLSLWADLDILLTNALLKYGAHLLNGKVDPTLLDKSWNFSKRETEKPLFELLISAYEANTLNTFFKALRPQNPLYLNSRKTLKNYTLLQKNGGWQKLVWQGAKTKLEPGDTNVFVFALRNRLAQEGFLDSANYTTDSVYDLPLQAAVAKFQQQHGLYPDTVLGKTTIALLNITVEEKVNAILCNLERMRWAVGNLSGSYILVNAAEYRLWYFEADTLRWQTEVIIGTPYNSTPFFKAELKRVVFNPTWTVPYSIATKEMLPKLRANPHYLASQNMILLSREGKIVNPGSVNFHKQSPKNFQYIIRQQPGKNNALGVVKFDMPNPYSIYMHDTPAKELFKRDERAFSHGCIRVNHPLVLAEMVLSKNKNWNPDTIQPVIESEITTRVSLENNIPVLLLYFTHYTRANGQAYFFKDIYGVDKVLLAALQP